jgi:AcrR family transcriptional regulator
MRYLEYCPVGAPDKISKMPRPVEFEPLTPERRRRQTRDHLLDAAAQVLAERGFHGASLDEVAAAAGFTKGAVYSNFKNKEDLFLALLETLHEREMEELDKTLHGSEVPPESRLSDFVALYRTEAGQLPGNWAALYLEFCVYSMRNPEARRKLAELNEAMIDSIADILETERSRRGIDTEESSTHLARIIQAFSRGVGMMRAIEPDAVDEAFLETAIAFLARGLTQAEPPTAAPPTA